MPHELRDPEPALRFLLQDADRNLFLIRKLYQGARPGFSIIVDDPDRIGAVLLVERPDWRVHPGEPVSLLLEAREPAAAIHMLGWLPKGGRYRVQTYRPELNRVLESLVAAESAAHRIHCVATPGGFHPSPLQEVVREVAPLERDLFREGLHLTRAGSDSRLFGLVRGNELLSVAALSEPEKDWISVHGVYTREWVRGRGYGTAVLSAATAAGLTAARAVTCGLPHGDHPSFRMLATLGYTPTCPEWMVVGSLI